MFVKIKTDYKDQVIESVTDEILKKNIENDCRFGKTFEIDIAKLSKDDQLGVLEFAKSVKARSIVVKISNYMESLDSPESVKMKDLEVFSSVAIEMVSKLKNKWLFRTDNNDYLLPYLIKKIRYHEATTRNGYSEPAKVVFDLYANTYDGKSSKTLVFEIQDIRGKTINEILNNDRVMLETDQLVADYKEVEETFLQEKLKYNKQYVTTGNVMSVSRYGRGSDSNSVTHIVVNDEEISTREYELRCSVPFWKDEDDIYDVPYHPYLEVYSLTTHEPLYVHMVNLEDYVYDDTLREKLVLPESHKDLLDILTEDLSILSGDIIKGKSNGTTILCKGEPGTGKTLTAEAYSEITHRPLYKVNSGQLGVGPSEVEESLEKILKRAERWGAVLLIDEADVYIRQRGDDMHQNAVVAAFLRTLEYFSGLLFMTTNRVNDVDDAIVSRCIASILYNKPDKDNAKRIWKVISNEFGLGIHDGLIEELVHKFPSMSGRDIKELARLTGRYCSAKNKEMDIQSFVSCAQFRGVEINEDDEVEKSVVGENDHDF